MHLGGLFNYTAKHKRLLHVNSEIEKLEQERLTLEKFEQAVGQLEQGLLEGHDLLKLAQQEYDNEIAQLVHEDLKGLEQQLSSLEFTNLFSEKIDAHNAFLSIQACSDNTNAQDWAEMLLRMYLRWTEQRGFASEIIALLPGDVAGIQSATIHIRGQYAYGCLRTEKGKHRLVRHSPFDLKNRLCTSFAEIFVAPEVDNEVEINHEDLRIDIFRGRRGGGAHVSRIDSAVQITHLPTNIVVQSELHRSAHKNKATAILYLKGKLYEMQQLQNSQLTKEIRSYDLDKLLIKDLRTGLEKKNVGAVLDGDLDDFAYLKVQDGVRHVQISKNV